jgi:quercetin dioxygenase-like cupin family protein
MTTHPNHPRVSNEEMHKRIVRFDELKHQGIPLMFIDSIIPGHHRMNYAVIGDTASENPDFKPAITAPHRFQIGVVCAPPGCGPAYHTHDYIELFMPLTGRWRYYWGYEPEGAPTGEATLDKWDIISLPPGLYRGFENISDEPAWLFAVLESHQVFEGKDPYWPDQIVNAAAQHGFKADDKGKMIKPDNYEQLRQQMFDELMKGVIR